MLKGKNAHIAFRFFKKGQIQLSEVSFKGRMELSPRIQRTKMVTPKPPHNPPPASRPVRRVMVDDTLKIGDVAGQNWGQNAADPPSGFRRNKCLILKVPKNFT